jgi:hypothetical protein
MLRRLVATGRPAMLVLPYISVCTEKAAHLTRVLRALGRQVRAPAVALGERCRRARSRRGRRAGAPSSIPPLAGTTGAASTPNAVPPLPFCPPSWL